MFTATLKNIIDCDRIAFAHIRNVKHFENGDFSEASHRDCDGGYADKNACKGLRLRSADGGKNADGSTREDT